MKQYLFIGDRTVNPKTCSWVYKKDWYRQGWIFKDEEAFLFKPDECCYIAESDYPNDEKHYTRTDIVQICRGDVEVATMIFYMLDWQHPETLYDEYIRENEEQLF